MKQSPFSARSAENVPFLLYILGTGEAIKAQAVITDIKVYDTIREVPMLNKF